MFLDELTPFMQELTRQPVAFLGGFASGLLRLDLTEDPVKSWLENQSVAGASAPKSAPSSQEQSGPTKISID